MSLNKIRGYLYKLAKYIGDIQAIEKAWKQRSVRPIVTRILRRIYGKIAGRGMGKIK